MYRLGENYMRFSMLLYVYAFAILHTNIHLKCALVVRVIILYGLLCSRKPGRSLREETRNPHKKRTSKRIVSLVCRGHAVKICGRQKLCMKLYEIPRKKGKICTSQAIITFRRIQVSQASYCVLCVYISILCLCMRNTEQGFNDLF